MDFEVNQELLKQFDIEVSSGYFEINLLNNSVLLSREIYQMLSWPPQGHPPRLEDIKSFIHPRELKRVYRHYCKAIETNSKFELPCQVIDKNGKRKIVYASGQVQFDERWGIKKFFGSVMDISPIFSLKLKLSDEEKKYRELVESAPVGIGISINFDIEYANKALINILGYETLEELRKKTLLEHTHPDDREKLVNTINRVVKGKIRPPFKISNRILRKDKSIRQLEIYVTNCRIANKSYNQVLIVDITEQIKLKEEQRKLAADALYINQQKKMLFEIKNELDRILKLNDSYKSNDFLKIYKIIESYLKFDKDWNIVKVHFEKIYPGFFKRLTLDFPTLTLNDLKHCACIKMNFTTKETARFFNIKVSSVQIARVRIKKKLNLQQHIDLKSYIINY